jgi:predicted AlkP superfamily pyrophosphatase or phosphodiesterase
VSGRVCLILIDGLRNDTARAACPWLMDQVAEGRAGLWTMEAALPTISAPLYETIHTGVEPGVHGLLNNEDLRASAHPSIFSQAKAAGRVTGVVGHGFFQTLFGGTAYDPYEHVEIDDPAAPIPHARYYSMEGYNQVNPVQPAEIDLCAQTWALARDRAPDYLLLHTCSCDTLGHFYTGLGAEYAAQAGLVDTALAALIPRLLGAGYAVFVTADHGMDETGDHGGDAACLREVPFFVFGARLTAKPEAMLDQRAIAPTVLAMLGVAVPETMRAAALV